VRLQGFDSLFLALNRNKKNLAVDLQRPEGKAIIMKLLREADVLVENFRPGVAERLGIGYEELRLVNPRLIYASMTGFGRTGPYRERKGQDSAAQALGGVAAMNGAREDPPTLVGIPVADFAAGMVLCQGILMALLARYRTGQGQRVETNLLDSVLFPQLVDLLAYMNTGQMGIRAPRGGSRPHAGPTSALYRVKDGYVVVQMSRSAKPISVMCKVLGLPDLAVDPRFDTNDKVLQNYCEMRDIFAAELLKKTVAQWVELFDKADAICVPVQSYAEVCQDPQVLHNQMVVEMDHPRGGKIRALGNPLKMDATPWQLRFGPAGPGTHTDQILDGMGCSPEQIAALRKNGIVG
jgi:formyl-CoA transferase